MRVVQVELLGEHANDGFETASEGGEKIITDVQGKQSVSRRIIGVSVLGSQDTTRRLLKIRRGSEQRSAVAIQLGWENRGLFESPVIPCSMHPCWTKLGTGKHERGSQ